MCAGESFNSMLSNDDLVAFRAQKEEGFTPASRRVVNTWGLYVAPRGTHVISCRVSRGAELERKVFDRNELEMNEHHEYIRATLAAQNIDLNAPPRMTLGREETLCLEGSLNIERGHPSLPELYIDGEGGQAERDYAIVGTLGEGGMGVVELAEQRTLSREVAIKRLRKHDHRHANALISEARVMGKLEHPNIIPIHAIGQDPELGPVVIMKRIAGESWADVLLADRERLAEHDESALNKHIDVLIQACNAVHFAHTSGVIHRDLKPDNIMLGAFGELYVVDWGIALDREKVEPDAVTGMAGTPGYMAPEMVLGTNPELTARCDVFLLGACLHEVLTGRMRHEGTNIFSVLKATIEVKPFVYDTHVPEELARICNRACQAQPEQRFESARAFQRALSDYLKHRSAQLLESAALERLASFNATNDDNEAQNLFNEARFAFEQSLKIWPGSERGRLGLQALLQGMFVREIGRGNVLGARSILDQLEAPSEEDVARLRSLENAREAEKERLAFLEREFDPNVLRPQRLRVMGIAIGITTLALTLSLIANPLPEIKMSPLRLFLTNVVTFAAVLALFAALVGRKRQRLTVYDRRYYAFVILVFSGQLFARAIGAIANTDPTVTVRIETVIFGMLAWLTPITGSKMRIVTMIALPLALLSAALPITTRYAGMLVTYILIAVVSLDLWRLPSQPNAELSP